MSLQSPIEPVTGEFDVVEWIRQQAGEDANVALGIGDDAAILKLPPGRELVITTDTLNAGIHFAHNAPADTVGHKSLAVCLSDLAAMGATPRWVLLSLSLPSMEPAWIESFIKGFLSLSKEFGVTLIGGDTCSGELAINVTALGLVEPGKALTRKGACPGDLVVVSGRLGDAALALARMSDGESPAESGLQALHKPMPRIALGTSLVEKATSCIDISDGLLADLGHVVLASACGAVIDVENLPAGPELLSCESEHRWHLQLTGGDDYELCFSIAPGRTAVLEQLSAELGLALSVIGRMVEGEGVTCVKPDGQVLELDLAGYQHFK